MFYFNCPHCKNSIRVPARYAGFRGTCKLCGGVIVPRESVEAPPPSPPEQAAAIPPVPAAPPSPNGSPTENAKESKALPIDSPLPYRPERESDPVVMERIKKEALAISHNSIEPLMLHQAYAMLIKHYWDYLHEGYDCLELLIQACAQQTDIASKVMDAIRASTIERLPVHRGFLYLARIRLRQGLYQKSVQLCTRATEQGWPGKWNDIIALCEEQLDSRDYQERMMYIMGNSGPGSNP